MLRSVIASVVVALAGCSFDAVSEGGPGPSSGGGGTTGGASTGGPTGGSGTRRASSRGGSSGATCGADSCPVCGTPYSCQADHCADGIWQCACGCVDSGVNPPCQVVCPMGCNLSADCSTCVPGSPNAGAGLPCRSDLDCCTGSCVGGICTANGCGTWSQPCATDGDCCQGLYCRGGSCAFGSIGVDGGGCPATNPPFAGSWSGSFTVNETFGGAAGAGGGGPDRETVVAGSSTGEILFQGFLGGALVHCTLPLQIQGPVFATVLPGATCQDAASGVWTFAAGSANLTAPCAMSLQASGTVVDPGESGTFTVSVSLTR